MEVGIIFKIGAVGILVSVLSLVLKHSGREDQAFLTSLAGLVLVLFWVLPYIYDLFETVKKFICPVECTLGVFLHLLLRLIFRQLHRISSTYAPRTPQKFGHN